MGYIVLIGFSSESRLKLGYTSWKGEALQRIIRHTDVAKLKIGNIAYGIAYFASSELEDFNCYEISIDDIYYTPTTLRLDYAIVKKLDLISATAKSLIRNILNSDSDSVDYLPFCFAIPEEKFSSYSDDEMLILQIRNLAKKNLWLEICQMFEPLESITEKPTFWNNHKLLNALAFATAKMSEVYINLRQEFNSKKEMKAYLKAKRRYRNITLQLRKRCIELAPDNPGYYSNLAFCYYQSCLELSTRGGRRDGSIRVDAEKAIEFINKALEIEPNRITDLYRKAFILTNILPPILLFGKNKFPDKNIITSVKEMIKEGIKAFQKVEEVYEIIPLIDEKRLIRYHKEYVKSLYDIARAYYQLIFNDWDYKLYLEEQFLKLNYESEIQNDLFNINLSIEYLNKCCVKDLPNIREMRTNPEIFAGADYDGYIEGVYKLYSLGKYYFTKYLLLYKTNNLLSDAEDAIHFAEKCFKRALSFPFPKEKRKINKAFIAEKLARIYILKRNYTKAIKTLEPFCKKKTDYYIRYTLALAYFLNNDFQNAKLQIEESLKFLPANKDPLTGYYFMYHIELKLGNYEKANQYLEKFKNQVDVA
ncbi:MAG: hypothetical protein N2490_07590 [Ignavibacteria bacterium]|nr:hypothetical protein [Ignavibacteria bacterium]